MNVRNHLIEIQCTRRNVDDVAQALIHSILFFRTHGKFNYRHEGSFSIGTLGFEKAFCDNIDFNYVRCSSLPLVSRINNRIQEFVDQINEHTHTGTLSLEFYTKKQTKWPFNDSKLVWELWYIKIIIIPRATPAAVANTLDRTHSLAATNTNFNPFTSDLHQNQRVTTESATKIEDQLSHKVLDIIKMVNDDRCALPHMPPQSNLDSVFDTSFSDLQPYLFNLSYKVSEIAPSSHSMIAGPTTKYSEGGPVTGSSNQSSLKRFLLGALEL